MPHLADGAPAAAVGELTQIYPGYDSLAAHDSTSGLGAGDPASMARGDTLSAAGLRAAMEMAPLTDCVPVAAVAGEPFAEGPWCWLLDDVRPVTPVPYRGRQLH